MLEIRTRWVKMTTLYSLPLSECSLSFQPMRRVVLEVCRVWAVCGGGGGVSCNTVRLTPLSEMRVLVWKQRDPIYPDGIAYRLSLFGFTTNTDMAARPNAGPKPIRLPIHTCTFHPRHGASLCFHTVNIHSSPLSFLCFSFLSAAASPHRTRTMTDGQASWRDLSLIFLSTCQGGTISCSPPLLFLHLLLHRPPPSLSPLLLSSQWAGDLSVIVVIHRSRKPPQRPRRSNKETSGDTSEPTLAPPEGSLACLLPPAEWPLLSGSRRRGIPCPSIFSGRYSFWRRSRERTSHAFPFCVDAAGAVDRCLPGGHAALPCSVGPLRCVQVPGLYGRGPDLGLHGLPTRGDRHDQVLEGYSGSPQHHLWRPSGDVLCPGEYKQKVTKLCFQTKTISVQTSVFSCDWKEPISKRLWASMLLLLKKTCSCSSRLKRSPGV